MIMHVLLPVVGSGALVFALATGALAQSGSTAPALGSTVNAGAKVTTTQPADSAAQKKQSKTGQSKTGQSKAWEPICPPDCGTSSKK
ncbi:hypothetical protein [Roseixanthobacter liquoris]|uniref:hypothetical protein n=1 Tax=Roseixanthobacter liquoris TaxID=3119921 RepID=UPI00372C7F02